MYMLRVSVLYMLFWCLSCLAMIGCSDTTGQKTEIVTDHEEIFHVHKVDPPPPHLRV